MGEIVEISGKRVGFCTPLSLSSPRRDAQRAERRELVSVVNNKIKLLSVVPTSLLGEEREAGRPEILNSN